MAVCGIALSPAGDVGKSSCPVRVCWGAAGLVHFYFDRIHRDWRVTLATLGTSDDRFGRRGLSTEYGSFIPELEKSQIPVIGRNVHDSAHFDFALFGDSHALSLAPLFDGVSKRHGLTGLVIATNGVSPFLLDEYDSSLTLAPQRSVLRWLQKSTLRMSVSLSVGIGNLTKVECCAAFCSVLTSLEEACVQRLWLFRQVPCQPLGDAYAQQIIASFRFPALVSLPRTSVEQYRRQVEIENALFNKRPVLRTLAVELVDTSGKCFDTKGYSRVLESGRALYRDDDHLSRKGAVELLGETVDYVMSRIAKERGAD